MKSILVIGEILVEIMADTIGTGFAEPIAMTGPYPSGAPAIFIDQVARMGQPCAIISTVGNDDFGRLNIRRLSDDGVDISGISTDNERPTGSAFVRYRQDGSRDFIFNIRNSACGRILLNTSAQKILATAEHLHIMGSSLSSEEYIEINLRTARALKSRGGTISFDPNLRKEISSNSKMLVVIEEILSLTDLYLPSGDELFISVNTLDEIEAVRLLLRRGIGAIVHKKGSAGAYYFDKNSSFYVKGFIVDEIDPTGAGDCFGGAFTSLWVQKVNPELALKTAAAAGALAVTKRGPMEGAAHLETLKEFIAKQVGPAP